MLSRSHNFIHYSNERPDGIGFEIPDFEKARIDNKVKSVSRIQSKIDKKVHAYKSKFDSLTLTLKDNRQGQVIDVIFGDES